MANIRRILDYETGLSMKLGRQIGYTDQQFINIKWLKQIVNADVGAITHLKLFPGTSIEDKYPPRVIKVTNLMRERALEILDIHNERDIRNTNRMKELTITQAGA